MGSPGDAAPVWREVPRKGRIEQASNAGADHSTDDRRVELTARVFRVLVVVRLALVMVAARGRADVRGGEA